MSTIWNIIFAAWVLGGIFLFWKINDKINESWKEAHGALRGYLSFVFWSMRCVLVLLGIFAVFQFLILVMIGMLDLIDLFNGSAKSQETNSLNSIIMLEQAASRNPDKPGI